MKELQGLCLDIQTEPPLEKGRDPGLIDSLKISIASSEEIREWSYGEIKKPETINYRTLKPERDGLFCAKIFGPIKDYECLCGKYKRIKHRGITCEKCGVEVIQSRVRRERMGHIELASPVVHIWFLRSLPSKIGLLLDLTIKEIESILYFERYAVIDGKKTPLQRGELLTETEYEEAINKYGENSFIAGMGAEAIRDLLRSLELKEIADQLSAELESASPGKKSKIARRLRVIKAFLESNTRPECVVLEVLPVIPPDLRPLIPLEGGRFASSDLNDLYRRVINRNNRLKKLIEMSAPELIIRNEKRMLQEAVDALIDNAKRARGLAGPGKRLLKSLSDVIRGKQGRFRQNLLGKRVDYSGRTVIVIGPELKLHQCGLPKIMALELFKPFIYNKLIERGYATNVKAAKKLVEQQRFEVWDVLAEVITEHSVLLNRAPTLHRLSIQAFEPVLIEGKAIQLHPLVCTAYNADFDGDQMAVHVPLSVEAQTESRVLMMSTNNILSPANGKPIIVPTQDIVLGLYYLTRERPLVKGEGKIFTPDEVLIAFDAGEADMHAKVKVRIDGKLLDTTVGRMILKDIVPEEVPFEYFNRVIDKKSVEALIGTTYRICGEKKTVILADRLKDLGYRIATIAGISISIDDLKVPSKKNLIIQRALKNVQDVEDTYKKGLITSGERYNRVVDIWYRTSEEVKQELIRELGEEVVKDENGKQARTTSFNPIFMMADSGARGSSDQIKQLAGMRGLMAKPSGEIIETPITSNFREGLNVLQYFISTHGARKGLADTALKTANAGYLTRRLVDVAHDCVVHEDDCGTLDGIWVTALVEGGEIIQRLFDRIVGRVALHDVVDPYSNEVVVKANEEITEDLAKKIEDAGIEDVEIRSALTCISRRGVCAKCYGRDLARGKIVEKGEAVGIIAAQSIGEPGTQLTMRTFHIGGVAKGKVEQKTVETKVDGTVKFQKTSFVKGKDGKLIVMDKHSEIVVVDNTGREKERYHLIVGSKLLVNDKDKVQKGQILAERDPFYIPILTEVTGIVKFGDIVEGVTIEDQVDELTGLSQKMTIPPRDPDLRPRISIKDDKGKTIRISEQSVARYQLPVKAIITVGEGDSVHAGDVIAKLPREVTKTKDITGGLPRVAELFEARRPKDYAIISEIDGRVTTVDDLKGKRRVVIIPDIGEPKEYIIAKGKHIHVKIGDRIRAGEPLVDGVINPHDLLQVLGEKALARHLVDETQEVYRLQGVNISDKHIEIIVRQMLKRVRIVDAGNTKFLVGEHIEKPVFEDENLRIKKAGGKPAIAEPLLLGVSKASLSNDSFMSAASFQETTRVLTEAAIAGKVDTLKGLKENVITGRLIPAGTGWKDYKKVKIREEEIIEEGTIMEAIAK
ncbi:MAG TPA: DNA-directed RNA polymerase subunit beta' [bacterium]